MKPRPIWIAIVLAAVLAMPACETAPSVDVQQTQKMLADIEVKRVELAGSLDVWEQRIEDLEADLADLPPDQAAPVLEAIDTAKTITSRIEHALMLADTAAADLQTRLDNYAETGQIDPITLVGEGLGTAAPMLPPPFNVYAGIASTLALTIGGWIFGKRKGVKIAENVALAVEAGKVNGVVNFNAPAVASRIRSVMTDEAAKVVNNATRAHRIDASTDDILMAAAGAADGNAATNATGTGPAAPDGS